MVLCPPLTILLLLIDVSEDSLVLIIILKYCFFFFFERQIWITDGPLEYHHATSTTTRSYPSPLGNNAYTPIQEETQ
ncbi:hypothetical protein Hanom_Chr01g00086311 [Helianthus anomalus]